MKKRNAKEEFIRIFWELYQENRIEKITIRKLCEIAGYNRTTFYAYFEDIYDLLEQSIQSILCPELFVQMVLKSEKKQVVVESVLLELFESKADYIHAILKNGHFHLLEEQILPIVKMQIIGEEENTSAEYAVRYQLSGVFGLLQLWFKEEGKILSKEELLELIYSLSNEGFINIVKRWNGIE